MTDEWLAVLPEAERLRAWAAFRAFFGSHSWRVLRRELELTTDQADDVVTWAMGLMMEDLRKRKAELGGDDE